MSCQSLVQRHVQEVRVYLSEIDTRLAVVTLNTIVLCIMLADSHILIISPIVFASRLAGYVSLVSQSSLENVRRAGQFITHYRFPPSVW